jgi:hypothetical protein
VDAVIQAPADAVEQPLHVLPAEAGEDGLAHVGLAVAVGVLEVEDVGGGPDEHAAVVAEDGRGPGELVGVDGALVEPPVAVGVFEQADGAEVLGGLFGVVDHLDDEHPAVLVEVDRDGAVDERLGRDLFDVEAGEGFEGCEGVGGLRRRDAGEFGGEVAGYSGIAGLGATGGLPARALGIAGTGGQAARGTRVGILCRLMLQGRVDEGVRLLAHLGGEVVAGVGVRDAQGVWRPQQLVHLFRRDLRLLHPLGGKVPVVKG